MTSPPLSCLKGRGGMHCRRAVFFANPFQKVKVRFLEPVSPGGLKDRDLLVLIRERMEDEQKELRDSWTR